MSFSINHKKEFIITFPRDFICFDKTLVENLCKSWCQKHSFNFVFGEEFGKNHNKKHYHIYLKSNNPKGFTTRNCRYFDYKLPKKIVSFYSVTGACENQLWFDHFGDNEELVKAHVIQNHYHNYKIIESAHPNIRFKGDKTKEYCKSTRDMIKYVTKEDKNPISNFDWKIVISEPPKKKRRVSDSIDFEFYIWLDKQLNSGYTEKQIWENINKNPEYTYFARKNYRSVKEQIIDFSKQINQPTPKPFWGIYYIPTALADYLEYLDIGHLNQLNYQLTYLLSIVRLNYLIWNILLF